MVTMARSKIIRGPYEANPANPVLTNANTTNYCKSQQLGYLGSHHFNKQLLVQTVGHADLFQDFTNNW